MANRGWPSEQGGDSRASNSTQAGRVTGVGNAESFVQGDKAATPGPNGDALDQRSDLYGSPGQMSTS